MNTLTVLLQQIGMFVIYIITGVILIRTKVLTRENLEIISKSCDQTVTAGDDLYQYGKRGGSEVIFFLIVHPRNCGSDVCVSADPGHLIRKSISSSWRTSAIISCNDCIRKTWDLWEFLLLSAYIRKKECCIWLFLRLLIS